MIVKIVALVPSLRVMRRGENFVVDWSRLMGGEVGSSSIAGMVGGLMGSISGKMSIFRYLR